MRWLPNRVNAVVNYRTILEAFADTGLLLRGGFVPRPDDALDGTGAVVLIGNVGPSLWPAFMAGRRDEPDALDRWSKRVVDPVAAGLGAVAVYPNDQPYHPFQGWAQRAETVHPSPLGLLIHPQHGLWHAYRAALLFTEAVEGLPARLNAPSPCDSCAGRPCLTACPVAAFDGVTYDVSACAGHLGAGHDPKCADLGCRARDACPVAPDQRYGPAQIAFHMAAFVKARGHAVRR